MGVEGGEEGCDGLCLFVGLGASDEDLATL